MKACLHWPARRAPVASFGEFFSAREGGNTRREEQGGPGEEEASSPFLVRARVSSKFLGTFTRAILLRNLSRDGNYN